MLDTGYLRRRLALILPVLLLLLVAVSWQTLSPYLLRVGAVITIIGGGLWLVLSGRRKRRRGLPIFVIPWLLFLLLQSASLFDAQIPRSAVNEVLIDVQYLIFFLLVEDSLTWGLTRRDWEDGLLILATVFCLLEGLLAVVWQLRWAHISGSFLSGPPVGYRATGILLQHPNVLSGFINLLLPILLIRTLTEHRLAHRALWIVTGALLAGVQLLTSSRGGWVGGAVALTVTVALFALSRPVASYSFGQLARRLSGRARWVLIGGLAVAIPVAWLAYRQIVLIGHQPISSARAVVWQTGWTVFQSAPWFGAGAGSLAVLAPNLTRTPPAFDANHAHDLWLQVAAQQGVAGLLVVLAIQALIFAQILSTWRRNRRDLALAAYLGAGAGLLTQHVVDYLFGVTLYGASAVCLLALASKDSPGWARLRTGRRGWLALGSALLALFAAATLWTLRGAFSYWDGVQAAAAGDWSTASQLICASHRTFPEDSLYSLECGLALQYENAFGYSKADASAAVAAYQHAVELSPRWPVAWANLAAAEWQAGQSSQAIRDLKQAVMAAPNSWVFSANLGNMQSCLGKADDARAAFALALRINPWLATSSWSGVPGLAATASDLRLDSYLQGTSALRWYGLQALAEGNLEAAGKTLRAAQLSSPRNSDVYADLALWYWRQGEAEAARHELAIARFIGGDTPYALEVGTEIADPSLTMPSAQSSAWNSLEYAKTTLGNQYSDKYLYAVYHMYFLPVDLAPQLLRSVVYDSTPHVDTALKALSNDPSLTATDAQAVHYVLKNQPNPRGCLAP